MKWYKRLCEEGFINAIFNKEFNGVRCEMHVNDTSMNPCDDVFGERRLEENTLFVSVSASLRTALCPGLSL